MAIPHAIKYSFDPKGSNQRGVISSSKLDNEEQRMISAVVNWDSPDKWADSIFDAFGRGIVFRSPTRKTTLEDALHGDYDGLQLIGAGGNMFYVQQGIVNLPSEIVIHPVDPTYHAEQLRDNVQLRHVNEQGEFEFTYRPYVPLHGMDVSEAENRARYTAFFNRVVENVFAAGKRVGFATPKLAAEGCFPDMHDLDGNDLRFQVYRVPTLRRLPRQLLEKIARSEGYEFMEHLEAVSRRVGQTVRNFHSSGLAYMDSHVGNMSWIDGGQRNALYVTDLGSIMDISKEAYPDSYRGFDVFMYLTSMLETLQIIANWPFTRIDKSHVREFVSDCLQVATHGAVMGYFGPEIRESPAAMDQIERGYFGNFSLTLAKLVEKKDLESFVQLFGQHRLTTTESDVYVRVQV